MFHKNEKNKKGSSLNNLILIFEEYLVSIIQNTNGLHQLLKRLTIEIVTA